MWHRDLFYQWAGMRMQGMGEGRKRGRMGCFQDGGPQFELFNFDWQSTMASSIHPSCSMGAGMLMVKSVGFQGCMSLAHFAVAELYEL